MADRRFTIQAYGEGGLQFWYEDGQRNGPFLDLPPDLSQAGQIDRLSTALGKVLDQDWQYLDGRKRSLVTEMASSSAAALVVGELRSDPGIPAAWDLQAEGTEIVSYFGAMDAEKLDRVRLAVRMYSRGMNRASQAGLASH